MPLKPPHLRVPFAITGSSAAVVEQDSAEEIEQCVEACLRTTLGSRIEAPEYGIPDETFTQLSPNPTADVYLTDVEKAEPRAHLLGEARIEAMIERIILTPEPARG